MAAPSFDFAACAVCLEQMKDKKPRFLSCHHSFCESCLQNLTKQERITCPTCRTETIVENNDVQRLTLNFHLLQFLEGANATVPGTEKLNFICHYCKNLEADKICETCSRLLCTECSIKHTKIQKFRGHVMLNLCWACKEHFEVFSNICKTCSVPVCDTCLMTHDDHDVEEVKPQEYIDEAASKMENMKKALESDLLQIRKFRVEDLEAADATTKIKSDVKNVIKALKGKVKECEETLRDVEKYEKLFGKITKTYDENDKEIINKLKEVEKFNLHKDKYPVTEIFNIKTSAKDYMSTRECKKIQRYSPPPFKVSKGLLYHISKIKITEPDVHPVKKDYLARKDSNKYKNTGIVFDCQTTTAHPWQDTLTPAMLAAVPPQEQKQMLGHRLYPLIQTMYPDWAGKITGMFLDLDNSEVLYMLQERSFLDAKVEEAVRVLNDHYYRGSYT